MFYGRQPMALSARKLLVLTLCVSFCVYSVHAVSKKGRGNADRELRLRRIDCEKEACAGYESEAKMMCAYRCISPECNSEIYGDDEIEEGEVDVDRARQFTACFRRIYKKEQDELLRQQREERLAKKAEAASSSG